MTDVRDRTVPRDPAFPVEMLATEKHTDGHWHAVYPTATRTLCSRPRETVKQTGRPGKPTCPPCSTAAVTFRSIDRSAPATWKAVAA